MPGMRTGTRRHPFRFGLDQCALRVAQGWPDLKYGCQSGEHGSSSSRTARDDMVVEAAVRFRPRNLSSFGMAGRCYDA